MPSDSICLHHSDCCSSPHEVDFIPLVVVEIGVLQFLGDGFVLFLTFAHLVCSRWNKQNKCDKFIGIYVFKLIALLLSLDTNNK